MLEVGLTSEKNSDDRRSSYLDKDKSNDNNTQSEPDKEREPLNLLSSEEEIELNLSTKQKIATSLSSISTDSKMNRKLFASIYIRNGLAKFDNQSINSLEPISRHEVKEE